MRFGFALFVTLVFAESLNETARVEYEVGASWFDVPGYSCGDRSPRTRIYYPIAKEGNMTFHPIVYGHGTLGGTDGCYKALRGVAALGFVVIVPYTQPKRGMGYMKCSDREWQDLILSLQTARNYTDFNVSTSALRNVDWSRVGIWGYSMGGKTAPTAARRASRLGFRVRAVVASHGARHTIHLRIPAMFTTGTRDFVERSNVTFSQFNRTPAHHKAYVNLRGGNHEEPSRLGRFNVWTGRFFGCHVGRFPEHCEAIYGKGRGAICADPNMAECIVYGTNPLGSAEALV